MPFIKQLPAAQAFEMQSASTRLPSTVKERGGLDLSNVQIEFQVTEQPLYLLVTQPGTVAAFLRKWNPEPWFNHGVVTKPLPSSLSGTADECDLCKNAQSLDFCTVNLYKLEPLCETYPQQREASESKQTHTHFMKERLQTRTCSRVFSEDEDIEPFSMILSTVCFQAFTFLFLMSRKVPELDAVSTLYLNAFAPFQNCLDRNWWWEWKLYVFRFEKSHWDPLFTIK